MAVCVTNITRVLPETVSLYQSAEVATVHEAMGRKGLLAPNIRPIYRPAKIAGPAVTCEVAPGDNWMIHVAAEQCQPGDVLVVTPTSECNMGYFGDLLATSLQARGVVGLVINGGVRDTLTLAEMKFPVWSSAISCQGTVKETLGNVNTPIICAGALVNPGDLVIADDDGVVVVPCGEAEATYEKVCQRVKNEEVKRKQLAAGELGLDIYNMRPRLKEKGFRWIASLNDGDSSL